MGLVNINFTKQTRMPTKAKSVRPKSNENSIQQEVASVLTTLKRLGNPRAREEMQTRYGIVTKDAFGVRMNEMQRVAKRLGRNHALALALWATGNYEARTVAIFVAEPARVTPALMDRWCRDFDNWAICDTACFKLFDRLPHAHDKVVQWAGRKDEFQKRAAFALLACLALHDDAADDKVFTKFLPLVETAAADERNFVKKSVSWALRAIGGRSVALHAETVKVAQRLKASASSSARWIGSDVLRDITRPVVARRLARAKK
jgi:3-methyladenine DNA glycosylase AlkD